MLTDFHRMINLGGLCGIITTNVERYAYAGFAFAFLICLCLIITSGAIFLAGYTKFGKWFLCLLLGLLLIHHLETQPPAENAIAALIGALRRRRSAAHSDPSQTEVAVPSPAEEGGPTTTRTDADIIAEAKSALRACLVL